MTRKELAFLIASLTCVLVTLQTLLDLDGVPFLVAGATCLYAYRRTAEARRFVPVRCIPLSSQSLRGRRI